MKARPYGAPSREPLSEARIVAAALAIADADGIDAVSMRAVAKALGVQAMSLYNHVASKDAIVDRMVDAIFAGVELQTSAPWRDALRGRAFSLRDALLRRPWAIGLLESRRAPGAITLAHHDAWIGVLRRAGFPAPLVAHTLAVVDAFVYGFVLQEVTLPLGKSEPIPDLAKEILASMPADALPHLAWLTAEHVMKPGYSYSAEFAFGLDLILGGVERLVSELLNPQGASS